MKPNRADLNDALIGHPLGASAEDPDGVLAKAGDDAAAMRHVSKLMIPEFLENIKNSLQGRSPIVVGVSSIEATGKNKIPLAMAKLIGHHLGLEVDTDIVQSNSPKRTSMNGLDRIFAAPKFDGPVQKGRDYFLVDDTLTQGATLASLSLHIKEHGGNVCGVATLTGKQYSARIRPDQEVLDKLREKYGDIEDKFRLAAGHGFDQLTQSEGRYVASYKPAQQVRDRILAFANEAERSLHGRLDGTKSFDGSSTRLNAGLTALAHRMTSSLLLDTEKPGDGKKHTPH